MTIGSVPQATNLAYTAVKIVGKVGSSMTLIAVGIIGGGLLGAKVLGGLTEKYYDKAGDANKMRSANIGIAVGAGIALGATVGGCFAIAVVINSLDLV